MTSQPLSEGTFLQIQHPSDWTHRDTEGSTEADGLRVVLLEVLRGVGGAAGGHLRDGPAVQKRLPLCALLLAQSRCAVIGRYKTFENLALMTSQAGVSTWMCADRSVHQPTQWTGANAAHLSVTHLGGHAHLRCHKSPILACNGQPQHTWWQVNLCEG